MDKKTFGKRPKLGPGPGRPKGLPNKATREVKELARALVEDPDYLTGLRRRLHAGRASHMEPILFYYAYGKPKEQLEHSGVIGLMPAKVVIELHTT